MSKSKQKAVALKYNVEEDAAPVVIASGYGSVAERIINIAEQKGIPVFRDDSAASLLCMLEIGNTIPPELYEVIAAIYCQVLQVSSEIKGNSQKELLSSHESAVRRGRRTDARRSAVNTVAVRRKKPPQDKEPDSE